TGFIIVMACDGSRCASHILTPKPGSTTNGSRVSTTNLSLSGRSRKAWQLVPQLQKQSFSTTIRSSSLCRVELAIFQDRDDFGLDRLAVDFDLFAVYVDVDLGADSEFAGHINAGLDGEADARRDSA